MPFISPSQHESFPPLIYYYASPGTIRNYDNRVVVIFLMMTSYPNFLVINIESENNNDHLPSIADPENELQTKDFKSFKNLILQRF